MKLLWDLYRAFFTIGALTFGGGYAMLPMLASSQTTESGVTSSTPVSSSTPQNP